MSWKCTNVPASRRGSNSRMIRLTSPAGPSVWVESTKNKSPARAWSTWSGRRLSTGGARARSDRAARPLCRAPRIGRRKWIDRQHLRAIAGVRGGREAQRRGHAASDLHDPARLVSAHEGVQEVSLHRTVARLAIRGARARRRLSPAGRPPRRLTVEATKASWSSTFAPATPKKLYGFRQSVVRRR